jgi:CheY-like chemotaxis protein
MTSNDLLVPNPEPVLIIATPGRFRDSLGALLKTIPWLRVVDQVDNTTLALKILQQCPKLIFLDANLPDNQAWTLLRLAKMDCPHLRSLVIANTLEQKQLARRSGADAVLLKGFAASELSLTARRLLFPEK